MFYHVKALAQMAGISVRTLHHYDAIGLLKPVKWTESAYRLYDASSVARLQQILFFKELNFSLADIKTFLDQPDFDPVSALQMHRDLLVQKQERLERIIETLDVSLQALIRQESLPLDNPFGGLNMQEIHQQQAKYAEEVKARWGQTETYRESAAKTAKYGTQEWAQIQAEAAAINQSFAQHLGEGPGHPEVQAAVARWQEHISRHFYACSSEVLAGLGQMYSQDSRFAQHYDDIAPGLSVFVSEAIALYCAHQSTQ